VDRTVGTPPYMSPEQCLGQPVAAASDVYSLGCLLCELLTGDQPFFETDFMPLRAHHLQTPPPRVRERRPGIPATVDELVASMLAKDAGARPSAEDVYAALLPFALTEPMAAAVVSAEEQDPTRPFRRPLLAAPARPAEPAAGRGPLTDAEAKLVLGNVDALLQAQHPAEAIGMLEDAVGRAPDAALALDLRRALAAALFYAGQYTRAATLFDTVGSDYRRYMPAADPLVLDCAYHAGHAYAETGKPAKALPQLRFYVENADAGRDPGAAAAELTELRPLLVAAFSERSTQVRNLDKQVARLRVPGTGQEGP